MEIQQVFFFVFFFYQVFMGLNGTRTEAINDYELTD